MLLMLLATLGLAFVIAARAVSQKRAAGPLALLGALLVIYSAALIGASAASGGTRLKPGDVKCFDEWCAAMVNARADRASGTLTVGVRLENHGRGAQTSRLASAFVESGGQRFSPRNPGDLHAVVPGQGSLDLRLVFTLPAPPATARFVVTEAASGHLTPGALVIGDESSPFHSIAGWPLDESVMQPGR